MDHLGVNILMVSLEDRSLITSPNLEEAFSGMHSILSQMGIENRSESEYASETLPTSSGVGVGETLLRGVMATAIASTGVVALTETIRPQLSSSSESGNATHWYEINANRFTDELGYGSLFVEVAAYSQAIETLNELRDIRNIWPDYDGEDIEATAVERATSLIEQVYKERVVVSRSVPVVSIGPEGSVFLRWTLDDQANVDVFVYSDSTNVIVSRDSRLFHFEDSSDEDILSLVSSGIRFVTENG